MFTPITNVFHLAVRNTGLFVLFLLSFTCSAISLTTTYVIHAHLFQQLHNISKKAAYLEIVSKQAWYSPVFFFIHGGPAIASKYAIYDVFRGHLGLDPSKTATSFVAGGLAAFVSTVCSYPLSTTRTRLRHRAAQLDPPSGMASLSQEVWKEHGIRGFYRGFGFTATGLIVYHSLFFGLYETSKHHMHPLLYDVRDQSRARAFGIDICCGLIAVAAATLLSQPFYIINHAFQHHAEHFGFEESASPLHTLKLWTKDTGKSASRIILERMKISPFTINSICAAALTISSFDLLQKLLLGKDYSTPKHQLS